VSERVSCNVVCHPFYSSREAHTRVLSPDMWAQGQNGRKEVTNACNVWAISERHNVRSSYSIDMLRLHPR
jgi:hypothetical protein